MMRKKIPDYEDFNSKIHQYVAATGGGDGWDAKYPIHNSIVADLEAVAELNTGTDEEYIKMVNMPLEDWINLLEVYRRTIYIDEIDLVAEFNTSTWEWERK